ncbi:ATP-binding protein [Cyclobacterium xiamenense]|uniref:ATP-binding protein n=1 Tax=Cyclobacterium xiamenense TaxID=1297121 RepID=UPI0012B7DA03|nr:ATP-binding protein [Cyclobacterium xiamenense]
MLFYNRDSELSILRRVQASAVQSAQMTFMVGRRRMGKTSLLLEAYKTDIFLYFFIAKKNEALLCLEFAEEIKQKLAIPIFGEIKTFTGLFSFLMNVSKERHFTLIIDEFQEFSSVNPSVFSEMQRTWDNCKNESKINLILCGSIYSMMTRIFENAKEPLFGRATQRIHLKAFDIPTQKKILGDFHPNFSNEDLLAFFMITGGVPKYIELLVQRNAFTEKKILQEVISEGSLFLDEGKNILIEEFGKEYGNYFSILSLISSGKTSRVEIESIMEMQTGGFLERLENEYGIIKKVRPILAKPTSRSVKYTIEDNFLRFWFRFIYKNRSAIEAGNLEYILEIVKRDYSTFSGKTLERYFIERLKSEKKFNLLGTYWEKNSENEIDIVAINEMTKNVLFAEVKRNKNAIRLEKVKKKSERLLLKFIDYQILYKGYSLDDL